MAEGGKEDETWWGGWLQTAKEKSASALEFMKKDLSEFTCTMHNDTTEVTEQIKGNLTQEKAASASTRVRDGMTRILGGITKVLTIPPDEQDDRPEIISGSVMYDHTKAQLRAVQMDPGTYLDEPPGPRQQFEEWKAGFDLEGTKGDISELLVANVEVRGMYTQLVPSLVSHALFWQRYFYRVKQLNEEANRRAALKKRADTSQTDQELAWDDDDWCDAEGSPTGERASPERRLAAPAQVDASPESTSNQECTPEKPPEDVSPLQEPNVKTQQISQESKESNENINKSDTKILDNVTKVESIVAITESPAEKTSADAEKIEPEIAKDIEEAPKEIIEPICTESQSTEKVVDPTEPEEIKKCEVVHSNISTEGDQATIDELKTRDKGDMVVVGVTTPTSSHSDSSNGNGKETASLDDDWEKDFDVEVTEEDMKLAQEATKLLKEKGQTVGEDDDWENWE